jgi:hypothetical protein
LNTGNVIGNIFDSEQNYDYDAFAPDHFSEKRVQWDQRIKITTEIRHMKRN